MACLVRQLLENTSNDSFIRQSFTEHVAVEKLLMKPSDHAVAEPPTEDEVIEGFTNEPLTDFSIDENRTAMQQALDDARSEFGQTYPLVIDGKSSESRSTSEFTESVGHCGNCRTRSIGVCGSGSRCR